ncbi:hypothetical protein V9K67_21350 [Paraflavisolibacter sp. H34]|uniref:hypothetical protein n=1 Tax=Huijunlia imazamoxiresistens TaxID=3127457 RepID=UPI00301690CF
MSNLKLAIEDLYSTFSQYTTLGIQHCDCGCIDEEDVMKLHSKPLRELNEDDLVSYHGSALFTWGDIEHYKHFLPRVFELYSIKRNSGLINLFDIGCKLEYAKWTDWPENEIQAVKSFVLADWIDFANDTTARVSDTDLINYLRFHDIEQLMQNWNITQSEKALRNFVMFFYYYGNLILDNRLKLNEKESNQELRKLIYANNLTEKLQEAFFKYEEKDKEYAEKVSIVLQMIEQQLKIDKVNNR